VYLELKIRGKEIYFYSQNNYEVDFLIREDLKIKQLIQVCFSVADESTKKREIRALVKASERLNCNDLIIITWDEEDEMEFNSNKIKLTPLWKWLLAPAVDPD